MEAEEEELQTKIRRLVQENFDGDFRKGFDHYGTGDGLDSKIGPSALERLLADANVGNWLTRSLWVEAVMKAMDTDKDGAISWDEFESILEDNPSSKTDAGMDTYPTS